MTKNVTLARRHSFPSFASPDAAMPAASSRVQVSGGRAAQLVVAGGKSPRESRDVMQVARRVGDFDIPLTLVHSEATLQTIRRSARTSKLRRRNKWPISS